MKSFYRHCVYLSCAFLILIASSRLSHSLTLHEALSLAKENLPSYKASQIKIKSSEALYNASLSPYLPSLDASASEGRIFSSLGEFKTRTYDLTLSYTVFDWGNRKAARNISRLNLDVSREEMRKILLDLEFSVKVAFYTAIAQKESLAQRKIQLQDAQKDYEVADGRYQFGVAKLSDVLQSSVRLEQARFNVIQAEGDLRKSLSELNSLIGRPLESEYEIQGTLEQDTKLPDIAGLYETALERPEIGQAQDTVRIAENNLSAIRSTFFPTLSVNASYIRNEGDSTGGAFFDEEKTVALRATWNIFELGKFFRSSSSEFEKTVSLENLNELKRLLLLDVQKTFEDFRTALNKLNVAEQQLKQAEHNYSQAFGEYKVGKADILSLVQAESLLASAREQLVSSRLNLRVSGALLERVSGIQDLRASAVQ